MRGERAVVIEAPLAVQQEGPGSILARLQPNGILAGLNAVSLQRDRTVDLESSRPVRAWRPGLAPVDDATEQVLATAGDGTGEVERERRAIHDLRHRAAFGTAGLGERT